MTSHKKMTSYRIASLRINHRTAMQVLLSAVLAAFISAGCAKHKDYNKGLVLMKKKKYEKAAAAFERVIKKYPEMGEAHYNLGACHYYMAVRAMDRGAKDEALKHLKQSISAKLKSRELFKKGKFAVIKNKEQRSRVLSHLDHLAAQWKKVAGNDQDLLMYLSGQKMPEPPPDLLQPPPGTPPAADTQPPTPATDTKPPTPATDTQLARPPAAGTRPTRPTADTRPARPEAPRKNR